MPKSKKQQSNRFIFTVSRNRMVRALLAAHTSLEQIATILGTTAADVRTEMHRIGRGAVTVGPGWLWMRSREETGTE